MAGSRPADSRICARRILHRYRDPGALQDCGPGIGALQPLDSQPNRDICMNIMITGAAGFIGGFLSRQMADAGHLLLGTDHAEPAAWQWGSFVRADIRDTAR